MDIFSLLKWKIVRITNTAHSSARKADGISSVHGSLGIPSLEVSSQATSRRLGTTWATVQEASDPVTKHAVLSLLQEREAPRLQQGLPVTAGLPHRLRPMGGGSRVVSSNCSRACADIHACRARRRIARGAAKSWKPSGMQNLSRTRGNNRNLHYFSKNLPTKRPPFWGPFLDSKTGTKSPGQANQIETE